VRWWSRSNLTNNLLRSKSIVWHSPKSVDIDDVKSQMVETVNRTDKIMKYQL
jgi:hypothetical protein